MEEAFPGAEIRLEQGGVVVPINRSTYLSSEPVLPIKPFYLSNRSTFQLPGCKVCIHVRLVCRTNLQPGGQALHELRQDAEAVSVWQVLPREGSRAHVRVTAWEAGVREDVVGLGQEEFVLEAGAS